MKTYCGLSGLTKMTGELCLVPLIESNSMPLFIMELFLLLLVWIEII